MQQAVEAIICESAEGALYLDWLVKSDPALDGGLVLREAVLEWNEAPPADLRLPIACRFERDSGGFVC